MTDHSKLTGSGQKEGESAPLAEEQQEESKHLLEKMMEINKLIQDVRTF